LRHLTLLLHRFAPRVRHSGHAQSFANISNKPTPRLPT
jgi:hypothetical protein